MGDRKSLLLADSIPTSNKIRVRIPTVGEILQDEEYYYSIANVLTAVPYQYMVQLDDIGKDFTKISEFQLFLELFRVIKDGDLSLFFGDLPTDGYDVYMDTSNETMMLYSDQNGMDYVINELIYYEISTAVRKINGFEKIKGKPGNEAAKKYLIEKERRRQKRHANKPYEPYLENLVIALVNSPEFKYNYAETLNLSIYQFNQSFEQIRRRIEFDNTMHGIYCGMIDSSSIKDRSCLSWIKTNQRY